MPLRLVGKTEDFSDPTKNKIVEINRMRIGIYFYEGKYYAYENECAHEGGPACEGIIVGNTECEVAPNGSIVKEFESSENLNISCPWHGIEYDLITGVCKANKKMKLKYIRTVVRNGQLLIVV